MELGMSRHAVAQPENNDAVRKLARMGFVAKGIVYMLVGGLAVSAAVQGGGQVGGGKNAVQEIGSQPFGQILLVLTAIGLMGYAAWRVVQAIKDPENVGTGAKGIAKRSGYAASAVMNGMLAVIAVQMVTGSGSGQNKGAKTFVADVMAEPFGQIIVAALGAWVLGAGIYQLYNAYSKKFVKKLKTHRMGHTERQWVVRAGRIGYAARGVVFPIVGIYMIVAAATYEPEKAKGIGGALREIASQPFGQLMLVVVAAGLFAYGVFMFVSAKYRRLGGAHAS